MMHDLVIDGVLVCVMRNTEWYTVVYDVQQRQVTVLVAVDSMPDGRSYVELGLAEQQGFAFQAIQAGIHLFNTFVLNQRGFQLVLPSHLPYDTHE